MHKLVIVCKYEPMARMSESVEELSTEFETPAKAELRALLWLTYRPNDIVMLLDLEAGEACDFCGKPIQEAVGWILSSNKWVHSDTGARMCYGQAITQARPKEDT